MTPLFNPRTFNPPAFDEETGRQLTAVLPHGAVESGGPVRRGNSKEVCCADPMRLLRGRCPWTTAAPTDFTAGLIYHADNVMLFHDIPSVIEQRINGGKMREPYRVAVWGIGGVGKAAIREIVRLDSLELVGALGHRPERLGQDVGEVLGIGSLGVQIAGEPATLIEAHPDVVLYTRLDPVDWKQTDEEILLLLEAGINVITSLAYGYLRFRDDGALERFERLAKAGGATLYATGVNGDFIGERLVVTLSGLCTEVEHVTMKEIWRHDFVGVGPHDPFGFGKPLEEAAMGDEMLTTGLERYHAGSVRHVARHMGVVLDSVQTSNIKLVAPADIEMPNGPPLLAGTLAGRVIRMSGISDGKEFYLSDSVFYCGTDLRPAEAIADTCWYIEIEGRPSLRTAMATSVSNLNDDKFYPGDPTTPGFYAIVAPLIQAIPVVVEGAPGVWEHPPAALHYQRELRPL
jgi:2,4-diaminopentanoate dehydrogenase